MYLYGGFQATKKVKFKYKKVFNYYFYMLELARLNSLIKELILKHCESR